MIIPLEELHKHEFALTDIKVIKQEPAYRVLNQKKRPFNGFLYIINGNCRYSFGEGEFELREGAIAYLPFDSCHRLEILSERISFYRVDFTVRVGNELVLFSDCPIKLADCAQKECADTISALEGDYGMGEDSVARMQKLCSIFSALCGINRRPAASRLMPAVNYLRENATKGVNCELLAELCFLGSSRFYDLFKNEFGVTPLEYRDSLLCRRACALLTAGDVSVKEAAMSLGFENAAYFSRFFKKHVGVSPSQYAKGY
jgi:AraC-like DNA-binding protein